MSLQKLHAEHDLFINDARAVYYICGPEKFMTDMQSVLQNWGVDGERIKLEVLVQDRSSGRKGRIRRVIRFLADFIMDYLFN